MPQPPVGIDLGTTFSGLAVINSAGRPEIVPNSNGQRATASAILFQEDGPIVIGENAVAALRGYPERVARQVKRKMGDLQWGFEVDGRRYTAIQMSGMILRKVKQDAENVVGPIESAVVTVPAYFDEIRRRATIEAAQLAGLDVLRAINEPTAAAIAYASSGGKPGLILVYDFGGGTFDATLVRVKSELEVEVIGSDGDRDLGGCDLDRTLAEYYNARLQEAKGVRIKEESGEWYGLENDAERGKRSLSGLPSIKPSVSWEGHTVNFDLRRSEFEEMASDYFLRTQMLVENVLAEANVQPGDVDDVLIVGGSTRIPAVREMLTKKFGRPPLTSLNPDEAIALGAAIQAGAIMQERGMGGMSPQAAERMASTRVGDVAPHSFGAIVIGEVGGVERLRNSILIKKNVPLPVTVEETYYTRFDGQEEIDCSVTQGEDPDPEFGIVKGTKTMRMPAGLPANSPIEVKYSYDLNGCLECIFREPTSGNSVKHSLADLGVVKDEVADDEVDFDDLLIT